MCQELRTVSGPSRGLLWVIHYCYPLCRRHRLGRAVHRCTVSEQEWRRSFTGRGPSVRLGILWKRAPQVGTARGRGWWVGRRVDEVVRPDRAALGGSWTVALRWGPHRSASLTLTRTLLRGPGPQCPPHPPPSAAESLPGAAAFGLSPPTVLSAPAATAESVARPASEGTKASGTGLRGGFREGDTTPSLEPSAPRCPGAGAWLRACAACRGRARGTGGRGARGLADAARDGGRARGDGQSGAWRLAGCGGGRAGRADWRVRRAGR